MTTWSVTRSDLSLALAEILHDFPAVREMTGAESYAELADLVCAYLTEHPSPAHVIRAEPPKREPLSAAVLAAAEAAGKALGQKLTTASGELAGQCAPSPSRSARLRYLADSQPLR